VLTPERAEALLDVLGTGGPERGTP
jgi:hypothetical protein